MGFRGASGACFPLRLKDITPGHETGIWGGRSGHPLWVLKKSPFSRPDNAISPEAELRSLRGVQRGQHKRIRAGFTLIELLFVLLIMGILGAIGFPRFSEYMDSRAGINARDAFRMTAARARAAAVQRGDVVVLWVKPGQDSILVVSNDAADTIHVLEFAGPESRVDLVAATALVICYLPRGFTHPGCGDGGALPEAVGFGTQRDTVWAVVNAVGQVER